jgi:hypothetical protein
MNAKQLIAAIAVFAAAGSAFADVTGTFDDFTNVPSTKTRAEVVAELKQAPAASQVANTEWVDSSTFIAKSSRTRDEVRAEAKEYAKAHKVNFDYEFGG